MPACGYRVLKLGPQPKPQAAAKAEGRVIESRFYRVEFDETNGGIVSIRDKRLDRELVDPKSPLRLNQYVYVAGGTGIHGSAPIRWVAPRPEDHGFR